MCLYRGCIPSKALLHVAKLIGEARHAESWGVKFGDPSIDLDRLRGFKDQVVQKMTGGLSQVAKLRKITYFQGKASFVDGKSLRVDLTARRRRDSRVRARDHRDRIAPVDRARLVD